MCRKTRVYQNFKKLSDLSGHWIYFVSMYAYGPCLFGRLLVSAKHIANWVSTFE